MAFVADFSPATLASAAGVNPWQLRDKLTAGNPTEIGSLASTFARAGGNQQLAATLKSRAQGYTRTGFQQDNTPIKAPEQHAAQVKKALNGSSAKLGQIATSLNDIASSLYQNATAANSRVRQLEGEVTVVTAYYKRDVQTATVGLTDPAEIERESRRIYAIKRNEAAALVRSAGGAVSQLVTAYETKLQAGQRTLSSLGYVPPNELSGGGSGGAFGAAQGTADGRNLRQLLLTEPRKIDANSLAALRRTQAAVAAINARVAAGGKLTSAEKAYLNNFYKAVGKDGLTKLPAYAHAAAAAATPSVRGESGSDRAAAIKAAATQALRPIANSILNLHNPAAGGYSGLAGAPADSPIRELVNTRAGAYVNGIHVADPRNHPVTNPDPKNPLGTGIAGLEEYGAFKDLLSASSVNVGTPFGKDLVHGASVFKQDLNHLQLQERTVIDRWLTGEDRRTAISLLDARVSDAAPSGILQVVAHDRTASANVLLDTDLRQNVIGLGWETETGASSLISAGAGRNTADSAADAALHAKAAHAVLSEVAKDPVAYSGLAGPGVGTSITRLGEQYIQSFYPTDSGKLPWGTDIHAPFTLTESDRDGFLRFIAGEGRTQEFRTVASAYSQLLLADGFARDAAPTHLSTVLTELGKLDGSITKAQFQALTYEGKTADEAHRIIAEQELLAQRKSATIVAAVVTAAFGAAAPIPGLAGAGPGVAGGLGAALGGLAVSEVAAQHIFGLSAESRSTTGREPAGEYLSNELARQDYRRNYLITNAALIAGKLDPDYPNLGPSQVESYTGSDGRQHHHLKPDAKPTNTPADGLLADYSSDYANDHAGQPGVTHMATKEQYNSGINSSLEGKDEKVEEKTAPGLPWTDSKSPKDFVYGGHVDQNVSGQTAPGQKRFWGPRHLDDPNYSTKAGVSSPNNNDE